MAGPIAKIVGALAKKASRGKLANPLVPSKYQQMKTKKLGGNPGTVPPENITPFEGRQRVAFPGVYANPTDIVNDALVAPESPNLNMLFDTSREELADLAATRVGLDPSWLPEGATKKPRGSAAAQRIMVPENAQRLIDMLEAAQKRPDLNTGMSGWMSQEPLLAQMRQIMDEDEAVRRFGQQNAFSSLASPGTNVVTELNRGSRADYMNEQGLLDDWLAGGGTPNKPVMQQGWNQPRTPFGLDPKMQGGLGHAYHVTAHGPPMSNYAESGSMGKGPKVGTYNLASTPDEIGGQTHLPTPDAHFTRILGLPDVRTSAKYDDSLSMSEFQDIGPWFNREVAQQAGVHSGIGQPVLWGAGGRQTGVDTAIGQPLLELKADAIVKMAQRRGMDPKKIRDLWMQGKHPIGSADPEMLAYIAAAMGGAAGGGALAKGHFANETNPLTGR